MSILKTAYDVMANTVAVARGCMVMDKPFFATIAFRLGIKSRKDCTRPAVDGVTMDFPPDYVEGLRPAQVQGMVAAMSIMCALGHPFRRGNRDKEIWSYCSSCIGGSAAREARFELPDDWPLDPDYTVNISIEEAYRLEEAKRQKNPNGSGRQPKQGGADVETPKSGSGKDKDKDDKGKGKKGKGDPGPGRQQGSGDEEGEDEPAGGSGSDGEGDDDGEGEGDGADDGQERDDQEIGGDTVSDSAASPEELRQMEDDWKIRMVQAGNAARRMGNVPAWMQWILDGINAPQVEWRAVLRRFLTETSKSDYSLMHPSRRYSGDVIFPGLYSEDIPRIVYVEDTSASVQSQEHKQFKGELNSMLEEFDMEVTVIYCDTEVAKVAVYTRDDLPIVDMAGGGGTDFRAPFKWVEENMDRQPTALIYCSDMECNRFPDPPPYPVLWVSTRPEGVTIRNTGGGVPFGELLFVTAE